MTPRPLYEVTKLSLGDYEVLQDGTPIASLVRNSHPQDSNEAWVVELLEDVPATQRPAPFTTQRHGFRSRSEALHWLGAPLRRVLNSNPHRQRSLTMRDRYQLRLLALHARFYGPNTSLQTLEQRGFIAPTGRTDGNARIEWAVTDAGRMALAEVE